jgi:hypothetical protein
VAMLAKNFGRLIKNDKFKKKFSERLKKPPKNLSLKKLRRKTQDAANVLNGQALGIYRLIVGISSRVKERPRMQLSVMNQKKKILLLKINF